MKSWEDNCDADNKIQDTKGLVEKQVIKLSSLRLSVKHLV